MTPTEAAAIAMLGAGHRRLLAAVLQSIRDPTTPADQRAPAAARGRRIAGSVGVPLSCRSPPDGGEPDASAMRTPRGEPVGRGRADGHRTPLSLPDPRYPTLLVDDSRSAARAVGEGPARRAAQAIDCHRRLACRRRRTRLAMARQLSRDLAAAGAVVVSGLARGVDSAAHSRRARREGTNGWRARLRHRSRLSARAPRARPRHRTCRRGRQRVSAWCAAAAASLSAAEPDHRRPVDGGRRRRGAGEERVAHHGRRRARARPRRDGRCRAPTTGGRNRGGHLLIRDGAKVVESADDILQDDRASQASGQGAAAASGNCQKRRDFTIDDVAEQSGEPAGVVLARLLELELRGQIQRIGGGRYIRVLT